MKFQKQIGSNNQVFIFPENLSCYLWVPSCSDSSYWILTIHWLAPCWGRILVAPPWTKGSWTFSYKQTTQLRLGHRVPLVQHMDQILLLSFIIHVKFRITLGWGKSIWCTHVPFTRLLVFFGRNCTLLRIWSAVKSPPNKLASSLSGPSCDIYDWLVASAVGWDPTGTFWALVSGYECTSKINLSFSAWTVWSSGFKHSLTWEAESSGILTHEGVLPDIFNKSCAISQGLYSITAWFNMTISPETQRQAYSWSMSRTLKLEFHLS